MKQWRLWATGLFFLPLLTSCVTTSGALSWSRREFKTEDAERGGFWHCSGHGCRVRQKAALSDAEWEKVRAVFGAPHGGAEERAKLEGALATLEVLVGAKVGTSRDVGGSFEGFGKPGQMDCVDEMLNVATYMDLLIKEGLVKEHRLGRRYTNQIFKTGSWPHTVTSIVEIKTGREYVVDSWWLANGNRPYIVPLEDWSEGTWEQPKSKKESRPIGLVVPKR